MKIIDAHLHFEQGGYWDVIAEEAGHVNTTAHLADTYKEHNVVHGIVMGNKPITETNCEYPQHLSYCVGIGHQTFDFNRIEEQMPLLEEHLRRDTCVGIKFYPGYSYFYIYESRFDPIYELAEKYNKPVAVHTGLTATDTALLKYSHPMVLDDAAVRHPHVQFVMCHMGEPWFMDAVAVMMKNQNVAADLSGILAGKLPDEEAFYRKNAYFVEQLKGQLTILQDYSRFMFGTDWPLANYGDYINFTKHIVPEEAWEAVFYENAKRIYRPKELL